MVTIYTTRDMIKRVAQRWYAQYSPDWRSVFSTNPVSSLDIYEQLLALPEDATKEDIHKIMRGMSWIGLHRDGCRQIVEAVAVFGDNYPCYLCERCLLEAVGCIQKRKQDEQ